MKMNRRLFLKKTAAGWLLSTGSLAFADYTKTKYSPNENAIIYLFLSGGPSHIETFNPIPLAAVERRSVTGVAQTNVAGMQLGGLFKELGKRGDRLSVFRGFGHRDANHASATHWLMTGEPGFANNGQKWPSYGSVVSGHYGTNVESNGMPTYVKVNPIQHDDASWMGSKYMGYDANAEGRDDLKLKVELERFARRKEIVSSIEQNSVIKGQLFAREWTDLREQAINVITGQASKAFKIEEDREYQNYKDNRLGTDMLTAIRLIESGCKFVTLNYGGWDMHNNIKTGLESRQTVLDSYLGKLMDSIKERGLYDNVMLVITGEFGRTPKINANAGRDHWAGLCPLAISCGAYEMGRVVGDSDEYATEAIDGKCGPEDLRYTVFSHLGIDKNSMWLSIEGRPMHLNKESSKNILTELS